jgi:arabinofuranan 3-O-arabinosyltransferase
MNHLRQTSPDRDASTLRGEADPVDIFKDRWLQSFGFAVAALYLLYFASLCRAGTWIVHSSGRPIYTDFAVWWMGGMQALHDNVAALYDPAEYARIQAALFRPGEAFYPNWPPYPPTFFLVLAPLAWLPYRDALITWDMVTLLGCAAIVYLIVRRRAAIALTLAAPFTAWNFIAAQNGFLTASLLGGSLLFLERRPVLAGVFLGCLTYKPQYGILFPLALVASRQWRTIATAAVTAALLAASSIALFGFGAWLALPHGLVVQTETSLLATTHSNWRYLQTVYGLTRQLEGTSAMAWLAQMATTAGLAAVVWRIWRSPLCYALKAATLAAAALLATPYAFAYDMAAIAIPAAFLVADQLERGVLPADKTIWIVLFGAPLAVLVTLGDSAHHITFGGTPVSLLTAAALFAAILRRAIAVPSTVAPGPSRANDELCMLRHGRDA